MNKKSLVTTLRRSIRNVGTIEKGMIVSWIMSGFHGYQGSFIYIAGISFLEDLFSKSTHFQSRLAVLFTFTIIVILAIDIDPLTEEKRPVYAVQNDYLTYENSKYKIMMQYPSDWEIVDDSKILGSYFYGTDNVVVEFLASNQSFYFRQDDQSTHNSLALVVEDHVNNSKTWVNSCSRLVIIESLLSR